ncbi:fucolectin-like [Mercenaria mercenaria]|uniref:fucolectin-like n=1 Tax=Mercenaria mercenaria TaxID=6596 RepID=UPI00234E3A3A|nr:fucolectin-like [Mercenaria mercenaria]
MELRSVTQSGSNKHAVMNKTESNASQNGTILGNLNSVGDVVEIACNTGYKYREANETKQAVCLPNGNWSMNGTDCVKDGNTTQYFSGRSCFHTDLQQDPWWRVDLGAICEIHSVKLFNRLDSKRVARRASNMTLSVGISQQSMQQVGYVPGQIDDIHTFSFLGGIEARYVQITHLGYEYLHLCEVQVFGFLE